MKTLANESERGEILRRLRTVTVSSTRRWGHMSVHQMICHLSDSFLAVTGRKPMSMATGPLQRTVIKWVALYAPLRWPPGYPTRPELDQAVGGTRPADFLTDVALLESLFGQFTTDARALEGRQHPIFGPMSRADWLRWAYLHTDHHLRQFGA